MARFSDNIIENIGNFGPNFLQQVKEALAALPEEGEGPRVIEAMLAIELSNPDRFNEEIARLT